jgi:glyoxylase-like metal-dependent hydrolase (beta-lactamase superfamily II)/rhodanese-related sulfurtransferase
MRDHSLASTITVGQLQSMLDAKQPVTVLDVRNAEERAEWAIPGSVHADVYEALKAGEPDALVNIAVPQDRPVVTVCGAGKVSLVAMEQLRERGVDALSLAGGMKAWSLAWNSANVTVPGSTAQIVQVRRTGKGCLSYLIGASGKAAVIDAAVDPEVYIALAAEHGLTITDILDTHIHADHLSRSRDLAARTWATLHLPETNRVAYHFAPLQNGDVLKLGDARLEVLHTPGHSLESTSYLLDGAALFTGDTLFLKGVGRPDLETAVDQVRDRTRLLWTSLHRLMGLPANTFVLPGHTDGPIDFDGIPVGATLGEVTERIHALFLDEAAFVETVLSRIPQTPANHATIVAFNEIGELPEGDVTDLEAGANRCAVT